MRNIHSLSAFHVTTIRKMTWFWRITETFSSNDTLSRFQPIAVHFAYYVRCEETSARYPRKPVTSFTYIHTYIHTYIYTYIHTYHFVSPQILSYNSRTWNLSEKIHITQNKTARHNTINNVKITVPKDNIVHKLIIEQFNINYKQAWFIKLLISTKRPKFSDRIKWVI